MKTEAGKKKISERRRKIREMAMRYGHKIHKPLKNIPEDSPRTPVERIAILRSCQQQLDLALTNAQVSAVAYARSLINTVNDPEAVDLEDTATLLNLKAMLGYVIDLFEALNVEGKTADKSDVLLSLQQAMDKLLDQEASQSF